MHPRAHNLRQSQCGKPQKLRPQRIIRQRRLEIRSQCRPPRWRKPRQIDDNPARQIPQPDLIRKRRQHRPVHRLVPGVSRQHAASIDVDRHQRGGWPERQRRPAGQFNDRPRQRIDRLRHISRRRPPAQPFAPSPAAIRRIIHDHRRGWVSRGKPPDRIGPPSGPAPPARPPARPPRSAGDPCSPAPPG